MEHIVKVCHLGLGIALWFIVLYCQDEAVLGMILWWGVWEFLWFTISDLFKKVGSLVHGRFFLEV